MKRFSLLLLLTALSVSAAEYYLSPSGKDSAAGTLNAPWQSFSKLNAALKPGDTGILLPGKYTGTLAPERSGERGKVITIKAQTPRTVSICGGPSGPGLQLHHKDFITIEGLDFTGFPRKRWAELFHVGFIRLQNCHFRDAVNVWNPLFADDAHDCKFMDLVVDGILGTTENTNIGSNLFDNSRCVRNVYCRITASRGGHTPFVLWNNCKDNVVRECVFDSRWARHFEFFNTERTLIENCLVTSGCHGTSTAGPGSKLQIRNSIFRYNLIAFNGDRPLWNGVYQWQNWEFFGMRHSRIYANTMAMNENGALQLADVPKQVMEDNVFKNNIFSHNNPGGDPVCASVVENMTSGQSIFRNNCFFGRKPGDKVLRLMKTSRTVGFFTLKEAEQKDPAMFQKNMELDPLFADLAGYDLRLKPESPAIDRGEALTHVWRDGSGNAVQVEDARYFYDGFGIEGEQGDLILIGSQTARVVFADTAQNTLILDRNLKWKKGDPIHLPFAGKAPDLGCFEYGLATGPRAKLQPLSPIEAYDCDFEPETIRSWNTRWYWKRGRSTGCALDMTAPAASGKGSMRIFTTPPPSKNWWDLPGLRAFISPVLWDLRKHPSVTFSYRIPKGTPVGLCVWPCLAEKHPAFLFLGGTSTRAVHNGEDLKLYELIDDGQWHTVTLDMRKLLEAHPTMTHIQHFGFHTWGNAGLNDCFWIDDFRIR